MGAVTPNTNNKVKYTYEHREFVTAKIFLEILPIITLTAFRIFQNVLFS